MRKCFKKCLALILVLSLLLPMAGAVAETDELIPAQPSTAQETENTDTLQDPSAETEETVQEEENATASLPFTDPEQLEQAIQTLSSGDPKTAIVIIKNTAKDKGTVKEKVLHSVAQLILASNVAKGLPVQVYSLTDTVNKPPVVISSLSEWHAFVGEMKALLVSSEMPINAASKTLSELLGKAKLTSANVKNTDFWILYSDLYNYDKPRRENLKTILKTTPDNRHNSITFLRFQIEADPVDENWLDIKLANNLVMKDYQNFHGFPLYFDNMAVDSYPVAKLILDTPLDCTSPFPAQEENGDFIWHHNGKTTLIQVVPGNGPVTVMRNVPVAASVNESSAEEETANPTGEESVSTDSAASDANTSADNNVPVENASDDNAANGENASDDNAADSENASDDNAADTENASDDNAANGENTSDDNAADTENTSDDNAANGENASDDNAANDENTSDDNAANGENAEEPASIFPLVLQLADPYSYIYLANLPAGEYRISGAAALKQVAYGIDDAYLRLQDFSFDSMLWHVENSVCTLELGLPQVTAENIHLSMRINDGEEISENIFIESSDENGHLVKAIVPKQDVGDGKVQFIARVDNHTLLSEEYSFTVKNRDLKLAGEDHATITYYYNTPSQENEPMAIDLSSYFVDEDQQPLVYSCTSDLISQEENSSRLIYTYADDTEPCELELSVTDQYSEPLKFYLTIEHCDGQQLIDNWSCENPVTDFEAHIGKNTTLSFTLPAAVTEQYTHLQKQYPSMPENPEEGLTITATVSSSLSADPAAIDYVITRQQDNSLLLSLELPPCEKNGDTFNITTSAQLNGYPIDTELVPPLSGIATNDIPTLAENIPVKLNVTANIEGAPDSRKPLEYSHIRAAQKNSALPETFVPAAFFHDLEHLEGLTVTIQAEPDALVQLYVNGTEAEKNEDHAWVLPPELSQTECNLSILDKGQYKITITATDGEFNCPDTFVWNIQVDSSYDTTFTIIIIAAIVLAIALVTLLILRQVRKPSFARMKSAMDMKISYSRYPSAMPVVTVPLHIYGKKEVNLAVLFIACQQMPLNTLPLDVLEEITLHPRKRHTFRLTLGKKAETLNVVINNQAQSIQKPIVFGENQSVRIYKDMNETLDFQIVLNKHFL